MSEILRAKGVTNQTAGEDLELDGGADHVKVPLSIDKLLKVLSGADEIFQVSENSVIPAVLTALIGTAASPTALHTVLAKAAANDGLIGFGVSTAPGAPEMVVGYAGSAGFVVIQATGTKPLIIQSVDKPAGTSQPITIKTGDGNVTGDLIFITGTAEITQGNIIFTSPNWSIDASGNLVSNNIYNKSEIDILIDATMKAPEAYDPTITGNYPITYSGSAVEAGDSYRITAAGTMGGITVNIEDLLIALVDVPAQVDANWMVAESNRDQATETVKGVALVSTQVKANLGTDDQSFITSLKLRNIALPNLSGTNTGNEVAAAEGTPGIAPIATQPTTDAGINDTDIVTPLKLRNAPEFKNYNAQVATPYLVAASDDTITMNVAGAGIFNLPTVVGIAGKVYTTVRLSPAGPNNITVTPNGIETIGGAASFVLNTFQQSITFQSDGVSNWVLI